MCAGSPYYKAQVTSRLATLGDDKNCSGLSGACNLGIRTEDDNGIEPLDP